MTTLDVFAACAEKMGENMDNDVFWHAVKKLCFYIIMHESKYGILVERHRHWFRSASAN